MGRDCDATRRVWTRLTRPIRTAMSGLSSGTGSWGGEGSRFLGGGEGERCLKKVKMVFILSIEMANGKEIEWKGIDIVE